MSEQAKAWRVRSEREYGPNPRRVVTIHSAPCEVREKSVKFAERVLVFGCNAVLPREDVRFNREDAITQFVVGRLAQIDRLRAEIRLAEAEVDAARTLTEADPLAVVAE
jgi:hypothetical protein